MRRLAQIILIFLLLVSGYESFSQAKKIPHAKGKPLRFKKNKKMAIICPIFIPNEYPYQGIGVKVGDPFAITYKLYLSPKFAVSLDGGTAASGLYSEFHKSNFENLKRIDSAIYDNHKVNQEIVVQARMVFHQKMLAESIEGLDFIIGLGWQFRDLDISYDFHTQDTFGNRFDGSSSFSDFTSGPELMLGLEYAYFRFPISLFTEINFFKNVQVSGSKLRLQGAVGVRYVF